MPSFPIGEIIQLAKDAGLSPRWIILFIFLWRLDLRVGQLLDWNNQEMVKLFDIHATIRTGKQKATRQHDDDLSADILPAPPDDDDYRPEVSKAD